MKLSNELVNICSEILVSDFIAPVEKKVLLLQQAR